MKALSSFIVLSYSLICFSQTKTKTDTLNLDSIFTEAPGTFVLYSIKKQQFLIYNNEKAITPYAVHSTSKAFWSIIALEEGLVKNEEEIIKWDSVKYPRTPGWPAGWASDQTIVTALNQSVNWYFIELLGLMTPEMIMNYLNKLDYQPGFKVEKVHYYGLTFNIKKSALEQIEFLKRLYYNEFNLSENTINIVKKGLLYKETNQYKLYSRTGLGPIDEDNAIGWYTGIIEKGDEVYFFAAHVISNDESKAAKLRFVYALKALKSQGLCTDL